MQLGYRWESQKERDHWEDQDVVGRTILKWILREIGWDGVDWMYMAEDRDQLLSNCNTDQCSTRRMKECSTCFICTLLFQFAQFMQLVLHNNSDVIPVVQVLAPF
jgi:hypothetical protein